MDIISTDLSKLYFRIELVSIRTGNQITNKGVWYFEFRLINSPEDYDDSEIIRNLMALWLKEIYGSRHDVYISSVCAGYFLVGLTNLFDMEHFNQCWNPDPVNIKVPRK